ncbi:MAG: hypothetical protein JWL61_479 [Gemmatimonadetes bacterium]|nr:hypothetical protein [Gemmatimonadota bacterium]
MRKLLLAAVLITACSKAKTPAVDTTATTTPPPPAAPAKLTAADFAGTWHGESKADGKDSVVAKWTTIRVTDNTGKFVYDGSKDTVKFTTTYDADSMIASSAAYTNPRTPKGPKVMFKSIGWLKGGKLTGKSVTLLASKPDSVLGRGTWEATKAP